MSDGSQSATIGELEEFWENEYAMPYSEENQTITTIRGLTEEYINAKSGALQSSPITKLLRQMIDDWDETEDEIDVEVRIEMLNMVGLQLDEVITTAIKIGNCDMLEYIVRHDICCESCNQHQYFRMLEIAIHDQYLRTQLTNILCQKISKCIDNDEEYIVEYDKLIFAVKHDFDVILTSLLNVLLKYRGSNKNNNNSKNNNKTNNQTAKSQNGGRNKQGTHFGCYYPSSVVTFEFVLNLLKIAVNGEYYKCEVALVRLLDEITQFSQKWGVKSHDLVKQCNTITNVCVSCLKNTTMTENDTTQSELNFVCCHSCEYCICSLCMSGHGMSGQNMDSSAYTNVKLYVYGSLLIDFDV